MNQTAQKLMNPLFLPLKRFPIAWIALLLFAIWYPLGKRHFGFDQVILGDVMAFLLGILTVYPAYFLNIAFRLRGEMGRPVKRRIQAPVYLFSIIWPILGVIIADSLDSKILAWTIPIFALIPVGMAFILPFWNAPYAFNRWPFAKKMILRFLITCLIGVLTFFILNILCYDLEHLKSLIVNGRLPEWTSTVSFLFLLPGLFLILIPVPERAIEGADGGNPN